MFYEYVDIMLVRASGSEICLHFSFHQPTTIHVYSGRQHSAVGELFAAYHVLCMHTLVGREA